MNMYLFLLANSSLVSSSYTSALTDESPTFCRDFICDTSGFILNTPCYFDTIQLNITVTGLYTIVSDSSLDTLGCLYNGSYEPTYYFINMIAIDDDSDANSQFRITIQLSAGGTYILLFTTHLPMQTGEFSVAVVGPGPVGLTKINAAGKKDSFT